MLPPRYDFAISPPCLIRRALLHAIDCRHIALIPLRCTPSMLPAAIALRHACAVIFLSYDAIDARLFSAAFAPIPGY